MTVEEMKKEISLYKYNLYFFVIIEISFTVEN